MSRPLSAPMSADRCRSLFALADSRVQIVAAGFLFYASLPVIPATHGQCPKPAAFMGIRRCPEAIAKGQLGTSLPVITSICVPIGFWSLTPVP
jgi:hypothetical protein